MRTVQDIYNHYQIMPGLQLHQLRVAAVGKMVADSLSSSVDTRTVVLVGLFHDMGNILKADLTTFPDLLGEKGIDYWQGVKDDFAHRYGTDVHDATISIAKEIGLPANAIDTMNNMGFSNLSNIRDGLSLELKICEYSDCRVAPHTISSLKDRLYDARERYKGRRDNHDFPFDKETWNQLFQSAEDVERQIFNVSALDPAAINDESAAPIIEELKHFQVE